MSCNVIAAPFHWSEFEYHTYFIVTGERTAQECEYGLPCWLRVAGGIFGDEIPNLYPSMYCSMETVSINKIQLFVYG